MNNLIQKIRTERRPLILVALIGLMLPLLISGCTATSEVAPAEATEDAAQMEAEAQAYVEMSQEALAVHLNIAEESIAFVSVTEPAEVDGTYIIKLSVEGQLYEYHGRRDKVLLVSEPLPPAPTETAAAPVTSDASDQKYDYDLALVNTVEVLIDEDDPAPVSIKIEGSLRNGCESLYESHIEMTGGNTFTVELVTRQPTDMICTLALVPYEEVVSLGTEITDLPAGDYVVFINNEVETTFTWPG